MSARTLQEPRPPDGIGGQSTIWPEGEGRAVAVVYDGAADAARLVGSWNALSGLSLEQIERLGRHLSNYNADEVEDMLREGGV